MHRLGRARQTMDAPAPGAKGATAEVPRIDLLLCRCFKGKGWGPADEDMDALLQGVLPARPSIRKVHFVAPLCQAAGLAQAEALLKKREHHRLIIGACASSYYRSSLHLLAQRQGLPPHHFQIVELYPADWRMKLRQAPEALAQKMRGQLTVALAALEATETPPARSLALLGRALIVGGGLAGMRAALSLAERGIEVYLVEKSATLGGRALSQPYPTLEGLKPQALALELKARVEQHPKIHVQLRSEVVRSEGSLGRFTTQIRHLGETPKESQLLHGATILATGGREATTGAYGYLTSERILTQGELGHALNHGRLDPRTIETLVMIQCVESREAGGREYCSRVCCAQALNHARMLLAQHPAMQIYLLNREMMTHGALEQHYSEARGQGVIFIKYDLQHKPQVQPLGSKVEVRVLDPVLRQPLKLNADYLILSTGIEAEPSQRQLAQALGLELTADGFFQEAAAKWRPVDFLKEGLFMAGTAHSPQPLEEVLLQAEAAAQRAYAYLSRPQLPLPHAVSHVHHALCAQCQQCIEICPYQARRLDPLEVRILVDGAACKACGICAAACPNRAAEVQGHDERRMMSMLQAMLLP
jgi:heterodisulfide reductase subunit A